MPVEFAWTGDAAPDSYLCAFTAPRPPRSERLAAGKALRATVRCR
jgi:hypothetical protein